MKGIERVYKENLIISGKRASSRIGGFYYRVGKIEVSESKIFVCLDVRDYVKFGKRWISYDYPIKKILINDDRKPEYRDTSRDVKGDDLNRVYCYDYDGNMLWQMKPAEFKEIPKFKQYPIIGMEYDRKKKELFVRDNKGQEYELDLDTGSAISVRVVKRK
ncbi:MAG: hypothetical protein LBB44_01705 [Endomicrobium sp.]|jgi:hypothetical protein|nr:hypothetical protein [Endomicrobium sp.]